jgi:hypothetical protein
MIKRLKARLSYANVMATIAVFVAIGGGVTLAAVGGSGKVKFGGEKGISGGGFENVLSVPGVGKIQAQCLKGTFIRFKNTSGKSLYVTVEDPDSDGFTDALLADGESIQEVSVGTQTFRFHAFRAAGGGTPAADITVGAKWTVDCGPRAVIAQAVSKG